MSILTVNLNNTTAGNITYSSIGVTVNANSKLGIPFGYAKTLLSDSNFISDVTAGNMTLDNGTATFNGLPVLTYIQTNIVPLSDFAGIGTITALQGTVVAETNGCSSAVFNLTGTWSAIMQIEGLAGDAVTWESITALAEDAGSSSFISFNTTLVVPCGGYSQVRLRASTFTSGTVNVAWDSSIGGNVQQVYSLVASGFLATVTQGPQGSIASPWFTKPSDGTNPLFTAAAALADATANPTEGSIGTNNFLFNGTTWDRQRNNVSSGAAIDTEALSGAGTTNGATQTNFNSRGAIFTFVSSALSGTSPSVTINVMYSYDGGTTFVAIPGAATAAIITATTTVLQVYPGAVTTANQSVSWVLPRIFRLQYVFTGSATPKMTVNSYVHYVI